MNEENKQASMPLKFNQSLFSRASTLSQKKFKLQQRFTQKQQTIEEVGLSQMEEISIKAFTRSPKSISQQTSQIVESNISHERDQSAGKSQYSFRTDSQSIENKLSQDIESENDKLFEEPEPTNRRTINQFHLPRAIVESDVTSHGLQQPYKITFRTGESNSGLSFDSIPMQVSNYDLIIHQDDVQINSVQKDIYYRIQEDGKFEFCELYMTQLTSQLTLNEIKNTILKDYFGTASMSNFKATQLRILVDGTYRCLEDDGQLQRLQSYEFVLHVKHKTINEPSLKDLAHEIRQLKINEENSKQNIEEHAKILDQQKQNIEKLKKDFKILNGQIQKTKNLNLSDKQIQSPINSLFKKKCIKESEEEILKLKTEVTKMKKKMDKMKELLEQNNINIQSMHSVSGSSENGDSTIQTLGFGNESQKCLTKIYSKKQVKQKFLEFQQNSIRQATTSLKQYYQQKNSKISKLDMAFMFADPIIKDDVNNPKKMIETHMPLDLDKEYMDIKESICNEAKKFTIKKIAINSRSLQDTVISNPKIIHISCHGDFSKKDKLFYLAFEEEHIGKEVKFMENNLSEILGSAKGHQIKLAFINACHSGKMGEKFFNAGVPVVVCVDSGEEIDDEACKIFSQTFYTNLVKGQSIKQSFTQAKALVGVNNKFSPCCCSHNHSLECWWFKMYKENQEEAHELHSGECQCNMKNREHNIMCPQLIKFNKKKREIKQQAKKEKNLDKNVESQPVNSVMAAFMENLSDDDQTLEVSSDDEDDEKINEMMMCCCKHNLTHDESLKFQLLYNEATESDQNLDKIRGRSIKISKKEAQKCLDLIKEKKLADKYNPKEIKKEDLKEVVVNAGIQWKHIGELAFENGFKKVNFEQFFIAAERGYSILDNLIFENLKDGILEEKHKKNPEIPKIAFNKDTEWIELLGRHNEIHELLKYLSGKQENQGKVGEKIYIIHDKGHSCSQPISKFSVQYLQNRNYFQDGSYFLDMENVDQSVDIYTNLCKKIGLIEGGVEDLVKHVQDQQICLIIANCDLIIQKDLEKFSKDLKKLVEAKFMKVIILTQQIKLIEIPNQYLVNQIIIEKLDKKYQQKLCYKLFKNNKLSRTQNITWEEIKQDKLFRDFEFTIDQIMEMCSYDKPLEKIYKRQSYLKGMEGKKSDQELAKFRFEYIQNKSNFTTIKQLLYVLTFLPTGMTLHDISQLNDTQPEGFNHLKDQQLIEFFEEFVENDRKKVRKQYLKVENDEHGKIYKISLEQSIRQYIFNEIISKPTEKDKAEIKKVQDIILGFFSKQLRAQVLGKMNDFDLYVLSCKINSGIWESPTNKEESENFEVEIMEDLDKFCDAWLTNIEYCFKLFEDRFFSFEDNKNFENYFSEIILCSTSIMIERNSYAQALEMIKRGIEICDQNVLQKIKVKLLLMKASIDIIRQKSVSQEIKKDLKQIEDEYCKLLNLQGEVYYLRAINGIIQLEEIQQNDNMENSEESPHNRQIYKSKTQVGNRNPRRRFSLMVQNNEQANFRQQTKSFSKEKKMEFDELYKIILQDFQWSMDHFKNNKQKIGNAKAIFLRTQFILDYSEDDIIQKQAAMLCAQLNEVEDDLYKNKNYQMIAESNIVQSQLNLVMGTEYEYYQTALKCAKIAKKYLNEFKIEQTQLQITAQHLVAISSKKLKQKQKNLFIIAQSMPIMKIHSEIECFHNISSKFQNDITQLMKKSKKQIDYKIEILNTQFLKKIDSCQVLHLRPSFHIHNCSSSVNSIGIEEQDFSLMNADINYLQTELNKSTENILQISLLILQMPNCEKIAKFFRDEIKVNHVIYFQVYDNGDKRENSWDQHQMKNDLVEQYMQQVILKFYKQIFEEGSTKSLKDSVNECNQSVQKIMNIQDETFKIQAKYLTLGGNEFLFDKEAKSEQLEYGGVFDLSATRTYLSHTQNKLFMMPIFEKGDYDRFQQLMKLLTSSKNKVLNIYGHNGVYRKKLLNEVSNYLRMRYYFPKGIYWLHTNSQSFHQDLRKIFNDLGQSKQVQNEFKHEFKPKNLFMKMNNDLSDSEEEIYDPPEDNCLIIIDDEQSQRLGEKALMTNIKSIIEQINNKVLILISEDQITIPLQEDSPEQESFEIEKLNNVEMSMYFKCLINSYSLLDQSLRKSFLENSTNSLSANLINTNDFDIEKSIIGKIQGNISVLQLMCYIVFSKYNKIELIKIEQKEKVEHKIVFQSNQPQEVKLQITSFMVKAEKRRDLMQSEITSQRDLSFLLKKDQEQVQEPTWPGTLHQVPHHKYLRKHITQAFAIKGTNSSLQRQTTLGHQKKKQGYTKRLFPKTKQTEIERISEKSKESSGSKFEIQSDNVKSNMSESLCFGSDSSGEDENICNLETKNFIQDNNSRDGCVRYHDIYVRAVAKDNKINLFIFMKNHEGEEFKPKFRIYKKQVDFIGNEKTELDNYELVDKMDVKEIIIYVKALKEEQSIDDDQT